MLGYSFLYANSVQDEFDLEIDIDKMIDKKFNSLIYGNILTRASAMTFHFLLSSFTNTHVSFFIAAKTATDK